MGLYGARHFGAMKNQNYSQYIKSPNDFVAMKKMGMKTGLVESMDLTSGPSGSLPTAEQHLQSLQSKKSSFDMKGAVNSASPYISMAGSAVSSGIDSSNTDYNLKYGSQSETATGIKDAVGSAIPVFGAINSVMGAAQSVLNKGNDYDEYGYNRNEGHGTAYMALGGLFDPAGSAIRALDEGGEGSGARALLSLTGLGGVTQFEYEQKQL